MNPRILIFALVAAAGTLQARVWTTADNRTFEADFVSATASSVTVKAPDGRIVPVDLKLLGQADRNFVAQQIAAKIAATPASPAAQTPIVPPDAVPAAGAKPFGAAMQPALKQGPYNDLLVSDWKQFEGKGKLQCMLFGAPIVDPAAKIPLVIYLHGKHNNVLSKANLGFASACAKPENFAKRPCIILAPQCPDDNGWSGATGVNVMGTVKDLISHLAIDKNRVYLAGHSMGGIGTYTLLNEEPRLFAAGIPISGTCNPGIAHNLQRMPLWIFHGEKDDVVSPEGDRALAKALEKTRAPVKYTEYPGEGHLIGGKVEADETVQEWLFEQKRK